MKRGRGRVQVEVREALDRGEKGSGGEEGKSKKQGQMRTQGCVCARV